jgi:Leucine-rich repeat (LRR) protein
MRFILLTFTSAILFASLTYAVSFRDFANNSNESVDVCDRGAIGEQITNDTSAANCAVVIKWKMASIKYLQVDSGNIDQIAPADLDGLDSLETLIVSFNPISKIPTDAFRKVPNLRKFDCSYCQIRSIPRGAFRTARSLEFFKVSYGELEHIENGAFTGATSITHIDVSYNPMRSMSISAAGLPAKTKVYRSPDMQINP